jgi:hypothetical protein
MYETPPHSGGVHRNHRHVGQEKASKKVKTDRFCQGTDPTANRDSGDKKPVKAPKQAIFTFPVEQICCKSLVINISITFQSGKLFLTSSLYSIY